MNNDQLLNELLERFRNRFYGKYRGTVVDVDAATFRIKAQVPAVLGEQPSGWCWPCVPYAGSQVGIAFLPEVGSGVWIEFENGDVSAPIWVGCYWHSDEIPSQATDTAKAIVTKSGHAMVFDDSNTTITITDATGNTITLNPEGVTVDDGTGNEISMTAEGITITDATGNEVSLAAEGITLQCSSNTIEVTLASVNINDTALQVLPG